MLRLARRACPECWKTSRHIFIYSYPYILIGTYTHMHTSLYTPWLARSLARPLVHSPTRPVSWRKTGSARRHPSSPAPQADAGGGYASSVK